MQGAITFAAILAFVVALILLIGIGPKRLPSWSKSKAGKGALASMALGLLVVLAIGIFAKAASAQSILDNKYGSFLNEVYVFAGVDYTRKVSPQCVAGSDRDRLTSNMGFGVQAWQSSDKEVKVDFGLTHHSCVLGVDRNSYDGFGVKVTYTPWRRKP